MYLLAPSPLEGIKGVSSYNLICIDSVLFCVPCDLCGKGFLLRKKSERTMKWLTGILLFLLLILQYTLWFGNGGLLRVWQISSMVAEQQEVNARLQERNQALEAEVIDLKEGIVAIEERARSDLGMIKQGETFFQVIEE